MQTYLIELYSCGHTRTCRCQAGSFSEAYEGAQAMIVDRAETDEPWEVIGVRRVDERTEAHRIAVMQETSQLIAVLDGLEKGIE